MNIVATLTQESIEVRVLELEIEDFKKLKKDRYFFDWKKYNEGYSVYKLLKRDDDDILGAMAIIDVPNEQRIEIALLCCSKENYSNTKQYDRIAGCLIGFACRESIKKYGANAAVSLLPKTKIREHYKNKYHMEEAGRQLVLWDGNMINVINEYL